MFTRAVLTIFTWAFVLELLVLTYYLGKEPKPFEFYLNLGLTVFTAVVLIFVVSKEKRRKELEERETEEKKKER
ncbi:TM0026 family membrane protein [Fervidobacterium sp.]